MNLKQGDLVRWEWKDREAASRYTHDPYSCKSQTAIVLADGRWVDTFWHNLNDSEHCWSNDFEVPKERVLASFLVNTSDIVYLSGPREQYAESDTFYLCNGGGGSWSWYQHKDAVPQRELIRAVLESRLAKEQLDERWAKSQQERLTAQIADLDAGKEVRL